VAIQEARPRPQEFKRVNPMARRATPPESPRRREARSAVAIQRQKGADGPRHREARSAVAIQESRLQSPGIQAGKSDGRRERKSLTPRPAIARRRELLAPGMWHGARRR
jgi:hypothetical protein